MFCTCSSPGLSDEQRFKKRIEAMSGWKVGREESQVHIACEFTADSSGEKETAPGQ